MSITVIANPKAGHQITHQEALIDGLAAHGIHAQARASGAAVKTRCVACWGWRLGIQLRAAGHDVLVMERGYLGDRFKWTSLAWNGLNGHAEFPKLEPTPDRFINNFDLKPWRPDGDYILLMGQVPGDASLQGRDLQRWYEDTAKVAETVYKKPVIFRPHPEALKKGHKQKIDGLKNCTLPLEDSLEFAHLVVTFNSNSAVNSIVEGVPAIAFDKGTMAWDVVGRRIGERLTPCRKKWAESLAWKQWTIQEITSGYALLPFVSRIRYDQRY